MNRDPLGLWPASLFQGLSSGRLPQVGAPDETNPDLCNFHYGCERSANEGHFNAHAIYRIGKLSPASRCPLLQIVMPKSLKNIVMDMRSLEAFPKVATSVLSIANQPGVIPADVIEVVQTDAGITGKVLKLCNSAYYGFQREVGSLQEAGNMLGTDTLVNLVLTSSANKFFRSAGNVAPKRQEELWTSSITQALASRLIAKKFGYENPDRAYTAGLMQNIGTIVMDRFYTDELGHVLAEVQAGSSALAAERAVLGIHHAEIGARLATKWELPESLTDTIRFHHDPGNATIDPELACTVHLAETMMDIHTDADGTVVAPHEVCQAAFDLTGLTPEDFEVLQIELQAELIKAQALFSA